MLHDGIEKCYEAENDNDFASHNMAFGIGSIISVITLAYCCCKLARREITERDTRLEEDTEILKCSEDPVTRVLVIAKQIVRQKLCNKKAAISPARRKNLASISSDLDSSANLIGSDSNQCEEDQDDNICSICLEPFELQQEIAWSRDKTCFHCFHSACLVPWLMTQMDCPCCRKELLKKQDFLSVYQNLKASVDTNITDSDGVADEEQGGQELFAIINGQVVFGADARQQDDKQDKDNIGTDIPMEIDNTHREISTSSK